jgi:hypothetical protein
MPIHNAAILLFVGRNFATGGSKKIVAESFCHEIEKPDLTLILKVGVGIVNLSEG